MAVMNALVAGLLVVLVVQASATRCPQLLKAQGFSENFNETIAHAIHSITLNELRKFNPKATERNGIPVVNMHASNPAQLVLPDAPLELIGGDFDGEAMNTVDKILSGLGQKGDSFGPNWSPLDRVIHGLHMEDVWGKIRKLYLVLGQPEQQICQCLTDTRANGVYDAIRWAAENYQTRPLLTLLNKPLPKLTDAKSWAVWKERLLHYYNPRALKDAARYLRCALHN